MDARNFVGELSRIKLDGVFNPYSDKCETHDLKNAPEVRRKNLVSYLNAVQELGVDTIWMGRDLGYRGGRRTGLALTDEAHLEDMDLLYPGAVTNKATIGPAVGERTATEIWSMIRRLRRPPLLWNVFPFHPHEPETQLSNRKFTSKELNVVREINSTLINWLKITKIIAIGQDAAGYGAAFGIQIKCVRHPSYGGVREFRSGMELIYKDDLTSCNEEQQLLFA